MKTKIKVRNIIQEAIDSLISGYKGSSLTDIFIIYDEENGELSIYDDEENILAKEIIDEQGNLRNDENDFTDILRSVVHEMSDEGLFSSLDIFTPFSVNLANEDFVIIEELATIDDDSVIRLDDDFLKRIDKEFDDFLDKLLKE